MNASWRRSARATDLKTHRGAVELDVAVDARAIRLDPAGPTCCRLKELVASEGDAIVVVLQRWRLPISAEGRRSCSAPAFTGFGQGDPMTRLCSSTRTTVGAWERASASSMIA